MLTRSVLTLCLALLAPALLIAADPEPDPSELPRIPPKSTEEALAAFQLKPGFRIELVASEPLLEDPIAIGFDATGAMFACEMRGYSERRDEELGRVSRLIDEDGDGVYDSSTVYVEGLKWPTGMIPWDGGVFVLAMPDIWYCKDTNGDGVADEKRVVFTGFGEGASRVNVQALANSLTWGPDHRIYGATAGNGGLVRQPDQPEDEALNLRGSDFSFDPRKLDLRKESGTAQYGLCFDDYGQRYVCSNSKHILAVYYSWPWNETGKLPSPLVSIPDDGGSAEVYRTSDVEPWRVVRTRWRVQGLVRGPVEGGGRAEGYFTSASGLSVYRGIALGEGFRGNIFVGDVGSNLLHRKLVQRSTDEVALTATRPADEQTVEFLTSTDNWFRPVQCNNGPDGALYVVDMYRETIEHPWSLPESIKAHLDLNSGNDRGRIWRVVAEDHERQPIPEIAAADTEALVRLLQNPNGWVRDAAQMQLHARQDPEALTLLAALVSDAPEPSARFAALHSYRALSGDLSTLLPTALKDASPEVRQLALRLSPAPDLAEAMADTDAWVRYEAVLHALDPDTPADLASLLSKSQGDPWIGQTIAAAASLRGNLAETFAPQTDLAFSASLLSGLGYRTSSEDAEVLAPLFARARTALSDASANASQRHAAIQLLGMNPTFETAELWAVIDSGDPDLGKLALEALQQRKADWQPSILERWADLPAAVQTLALARMNDARLLDALESGVLRTVEIPFSRQQSLRSHHDAAIKDRAIQLLGDAPSLNREEAAQQYRPALALQGDPQAGQAHFTQRCAICHLPEGDAEPLGPALNSFRAQGKSMILENLISPNREVAPQYSAWSAELADGSLLLGMLVQESADSVTLGIPGGGQRTIARAEIQRLSNTNQSLMPPALEAGLTLQQMADLLSFVKGEGAE